MQLLPPGIISPRLKQHAIQTLAGPRVRSSWKVVTIGVFQDMNLPRSSPLLSGLGLTAALAAFVGASCCVLPLLLAWAGLAGAWLIYLEPFVMHRQFLVVVAGVVIAAGSWLAWRRRASWGTLVVLTCATALALGAVAVTEYEGPLQRYVIVLKRGK